MICSPSADAEGDIFQLILLNAYAVMHLGFYNTVCITAST